MDHNFRSLSGGQKHYRKLKTEPHRYQRLIDHIREYRNRRKRDPAKHERHLALKRAAYQRRKQIINEDPEKLEEYRANARIQMAKCREQPYIKQKNSDLRANQNYKEKR